MKCLHTGRGGFRRRTKCGEAKLYGKEKTQHRLIAFIFNAFLISYFIGEKTCSLTTAMARSFLGDEKKWKIISLRRHKPFSSFGRSRIRRTIICQWCGCCCCCCLVSFRPKNSALMTDVCSVPRGPEIPSTDRKTNVCASVGSCVREPYRSSGTETPPPQSNLW